MAYNRNQAAKLLTDAEMTVFDASRADQIKQLTVTQLNAKIKRARTMRDKFRDLHRRQKVGTRSRTGTKVGLRGNANDRTAQKIQVFEEVLERFSARLPEVEAANEREAARAAAKKPVARKPAAKKSSEKKSSAQKSPAQKSPAQKSAAQKSAATRSSPSKSPASKSPANKSSARKAPAKGAKAEGSAASGRASGKSPAASRKPAAATKSAAASKKSASTRRPASARGTAPMRASVPSPRSRAIHAHIKASGRRVQSKRDSRR